MDLLDPALYAHGPPHGLFDALRPRSPVWMPLGPGLGAWAVLQHGQAERVLGDEATFSSAYGVRWPLSAAPRTRPGLQHLARGEGAPLRAQAGLLRAPLDREVVARATAALAGRVARDGAADLVADWAAPLAEEVVGEALGVIPGLRGEWAAAVRALEPTARPGLRWPFPAEAREAARGAHARLVEVLEYALDDAAAGALAGWQGLPRADAVGLGVLASEAGLVTLQDALALGGHAALGAPGLRGVRGLGEELLRWSAPVGHFARRAMGPATLGEAAVQPGDAVVVFFNAACRDPGVFEEPAALRPGREVSLALGGRLHRCVGGPLAVAAVEAGVEALLDHPTWRPGAIRWRESPFACGPVSAGLLDR
jgi:cytochrome P450